MSKAVPRARQEPSTIRWSNAQTYSLALVCLLLGLALGYLLRGSATAVAGDGGTQVVSAADIAPGQVPGMAGVPGGNFMTPEQVESAAQPLLQALKRNPGDAEVITRVGNFYYDAQQYAKAIEYYGQALKIRPDNADVRTDMGTAMWYAGNAEGAIAQFEKSLSYNPGHAPSLFNMGIVKWQGKSDAEGALRAWKRLLQISPNYAQAQKVQELIAMVQNARGGPGTQQ